jgi:GNAT superfamily N-acetyltransferase
LSTIRRAEARDHDDIWATLKPIFRAGDTYAIDRDIPRDAALEFWCEGNHTAYVFEDEGAILGTYYICPNQQGGGAHVCNCGFATTPAARGRGLARQMLSHALTTARTTGYRAMQFNFVVDTNKAALKIWADNGFEQVGRLPQAFDHPTEGPIDALVLYKTL